MEEIFLLIFSNGMFVKVNKCKFIYLHRYFDFLRKGLLQTRLILCSQCSKDGLELLITGPLPPTCWNYLQASPCTDVILNIFNCIFFI